jgi:hypothetical protein
MGHGVHGSPESCPGVFDVGAPSAGIACRTEGPGCCAAAKAGAAAIRPVADTPTRTVILAALRAVRRDGLPAGLPACAGRRRDGGGGVSWGMNEPRFFP